MLAVRDERRELTYEALLATGRTTWTIGERVRVYRTSTGSGGVVADSEDGARTPEDADPRDYDVEHYVRVLREIFAERLSRALEAGASCRDRRRPGPAVAVHGLAAGCAQRPHSPEARGQFPTSNSQFPINSQTSNSQNSQETPKAQTTKRLGSWFLAGSLGSWRLEVNWELGVAELWS